MRFSSSIYDIRPSTKKIKSNLLLVFSKSSNTTCSVRIARVHISMYERLGMHPLMLPIYQHFFLLSSHATCYCPVATINFHLTYEREKKCNINLVLVNISISNVICSANRNKFIRNICGSFVYWLRFNLRNVDPILVLLFGFFSYAREWIAIWQRQTATTFKVYQHKQQTWCLATRNKCTFCLSINKKLIDECNIRFCGADIHKMSGAIYID